MIEIFIVAPAGTVFVAACAVQMLNRLDRRRFTRELGSLTKRAEYEKWLAEVGLEGTTLETFQKIIDDANRNRALTGPADPSRRQ